MTEVRRYYYNSGKTFEQSLDVYKPIIQQEQGEDLPLVVLVVGSGWIGHRAIFYSIFSWWNSSGPKAFASRGCVTVCIRHRGSFPRVFPNEDQHLQFSVVPPFCMTMPISAAVLMGTPDLHEWDPIVVCSLLGLLLILVWGLLAIGTLGSAEFDEMMHDVADALEWIHRHKDSEILTISSTEKNSSTKQSTPPSLVFGGYSSGGHVAASLLQRPDMFHSRGLPPPEQFCDAALFISGVLAVRPPIKDKVQSTWLTDLVTHVVFGRTGAAKLPSPLHELHKAHPPIPHLLIGCTNEVFGLSWLDVFFCSEAFSEELSEKKGVPSRYVQVDSDHWRILSCQGLRHILKNELHWLMSNCKRDK